MHRLPNRIVAVMFGTVLVFVVTLGGFMLWMSRALDSQAWDQSVAQIRDARNNMLDLMQLTAVDYTKWEAAVEEIDAGNLGWTYENIGTSATTGQTAQVVVVWGGRYAEDFGWSDDGVEEARPGLLDPGTLGLVESRLATVPVGVYEATAFFAWREGELFVLAASRLENVELPGAAEARDEEMERLLLGRRVSEQTLGDIADSFLLAGLGITREAPVGRPSVPLLGGDGEPVAWLAWEAPQPGAAQLLRTLPPLAAALLLVSALAALGTALVRRSAKYLVRAEKEATEAARTDALTGLPNRVAFNEALAAPAPAGQRAILFLDVNDFKRINDSIGHAAGDRVIAELARRLAHLRDEGRLLARIGGDEFALLIAGPQAGPIAAEVAREIEQATAEPVAAAGHLLRITAAVGYAVQATAGTTGGDLLQQAELAMQEAKRHRDQGPVAFGAFIEQAVIDARAIEKALRAGLERKGEFSIAYQPIAAPSGHLARVEALARWTSPELGFVPPDRFIDVAERSGLINRLGRELLRLVCDDLAAHPRLQVSINISPIQLMTPTFVPDLLGEIAARGIEPARIEVELTESVVVDDPGLAAERLRELRAAGFSTALDDFGTGYSSIGYLRQMGFDTLKVDRSFVTGFCGAPDRLALVNAMILLAHALGLGVVCEGVETGEELQMLRELGCDLAQGYHLDRPQPLDRLAARWLAPGGGRTAVA